ncbi:MAG: hypothetical protein WC312_03165 [Candidatus Omnitrophota bacterium]|jgi:predicted DNA-binding protein
MPVIMDKELLIRIPTPLYKKAKKISKMKYKSLSAFVRDIIMDRVEDYITSDERKKISEGEKQYLKGKGVSWRTIKRG